MLCKSDLFFQQSDLNFLRHECKGSAPYVNNNVKPLSAKLALAATEAFLLDKIQITYNTMKH